MGTDLHRLAVRPQLTFEPDVVEFHDQAFVVTRDTPGFRENLARTNLMLRPRWTPRLPPLRVGRRVTWEEFQGRYVNQGSRGSCWSFAAIAALEARYRRQFGIDVDLSEQYFFHLGRATGLREDYASTIQGCENASSFWGGGGNSGSVAGLQGLWAAEERFAPYRDQGALDAIRLAVGAGDLDAPDTDNTPVTQEQLDLLEWDERNVPREARVNGRYRVKSFQGIGYDIDTLEQWIASGHEVTLDVDVKWQWDADFDGYTRDSAAGGGWHVVLLIGFDQDKEAFLIKNSWGEGRPVWLSYDFVRNHAGGAAVITDVHPVGDADRRQGWLGRWQMDHDGWRGQLVIRRFADESAPTKLGNYYRPDGTSLDVNGFMAQGGLRMSFTIAASPGHQRPGDMTGQRFDVYDFSWEPARAAGVTTWSGIPFGVQLSRDQLVPFVRREFAAADWIGEWQMDHDGWRGTLSITDLQRVALPFVDLTLLKASYTGADGRPHDVSGSLVDGRPHEAVVSIDFDGNRQPFRLLHHTWEQGVFSGTTEWGGMTFGVIGNKR